MLVDLVSKNFTKMRLVMRKLSSKLSKKQIMIISVILLVIFCFFGWFQFGGFLKDVIYYFLFTILAGQLVMYFYIHASKNAKDTSNEAPVSRAVEPEAPPEEVTEVRREYRRRRHPDAD